MMSASKISEAIRAKRKSLKESGEITDTAPLPGMNPQDIWNKEKEAQMEETIPGADERGSAPGSPTMETAQVDDSQSTEVLKKKMARVKAAFGRL